MPSARNAVLWGTRLAAPVVPLLQRKSKTIAPSLAGSEVGFKSWAPVISHVLLCALLLVGSLNMVDLHSVGKLPLTRVVKCPCNRIDWLGVLFVTFLVLYQMFESTNSSEDLSTSTGGTGQNESALILAKFCSVLRKTAQFTCWNDFPELIGELVVVLTILREVSSFYSFIEFGFVGWVWVPSPAWTLIQEWKWDFPIGVYLGSTLIWLLLVQPFSGRYRNY